MNAATSYHLKNAVTGALNYAIDYTKVITSVGNLLIPGSPEVETTLVAQVKRRHGKHIALSGRVNTGLRYAAYYLSNNNFQNHIGPFKQAVVLRTEI